MVKNLRELGGRPFPYIFPIVPRSLPAEVIEWGGGGGGGGHFVLADLLKLVPGCFSHAASTLEGLTEVAIRILVRSSHATYPQGPHSTPQSTKKRDIRAR